MAQRHRDIAVHRQTHFDGADSSEAVRKLGADCAHCPLNGAKPVLGDGPKDPLMVYVGEAPGRDEVMSGIPFIGVSGSIWEHWLERRGLSRRQVWVSNAVACFPPGGDMKAYLQRARKELKAANIEWKSPVECCRPRLFNETNVPVCKSCGKWVRGPDGLFCTCKTQKLMYPDANRTCPPYFIAMGNYAMESLYGVSGISSRRGYLENMELRRQKAMGLVDRKATECVKTETVTVKKAKKK